MGNFTYASRAMNGVFNQEITSLPKIHNYKRSITGSLGEESLIISEYLGDNILKKENKDDVAKVTSKEGAKSMVSALDELHKYGYLHLVLELKNIFIVKNGEADITGFNNLRRMSKITGEEVMNASSFYKAPEILSGEEGDCPTKPDVWALGIALYETATKDYALTGTNVDVVKLLKNDGLATKSTRPCPTWKA
jgi:serine/threonine protein kinase